MPNEGAKPRKSPSNIPLSREHVDVMSEVLQQEVDRAREAKRPTPKRTRRGKQIALFALVAVAAYVWIAAPGFLAVDEPPPPTRQEIENALRLTMYLQIQRIEAFRNANGRLPAHLDEAGPSVEGVRYDRVGGGHYRLFGSSGPVSLVYSSSESPQTFLGSAESLLEPPER